MNKKYHILTVAFFTILVMLAFSCTQQIAPPESMRFSAEITILDTTVSTSDSLVANATVTMKSITYGESYESETNEEGIAAFTNLLPDSYNILASGKRENSTEIVIINGQLQDTSLYIDSKDTLALKIIAQTSRSSSLVISEIYYAGAKSLIPTYFYDQFVEIYNQSSETIYLDSLIIANVDYGFMDDSLIQSTHANMFPGDGDDYPIGPGEFIVIAQDANDHSIYPINSVDLSNADFENYCTDIGDTDNNNVTNMVQIHKKYPGADVLYSTMNDAIVLMGKIKNPYKWGYTIYDNPAIYLPKWAVIDGVEYKQNTSYYDHKYLDAGIDGGITGGIPNYSTKSVERIIDHLEDGRVIFRDNNNSSTDFHVLNFPTPGYTTEVAE